MPDRQLPATDTVTLPVAPYGDLRVLAKPNPATGALRCLVESATVTGIFTLEPHFDPDDIDPDTTQLKIHYGDELPTGAHTGTYRPHRPLISGAIQLVDHSLIDARNPHGRTPPGPRIYHRDTTSGHRRARVPERVARHVHAIIAALATYWLQRPDLDQLRHTAARTLLKHTGLRRKQTIIAELQALIAARQHELDTHQAQLARMTELLANPDGTNPAAA
ncbi:hypothetical protein [Nonomuraea salmonea]|uniref:Uncharacterized protein n=1 Tax=Nonomuraea salmonea TaxID=46181 RepID=A0ABV5NQH4_9ACTN